MIVAMRLLILGGTSFVGRAIVVDALARGDDVTLFHRGRSGADLFPTVTRRLGDRDDGDYASLAAGTWDAVVDVSAYLPRHVAQAIAAVGQRCGRYLFISTGSVYDREGGGTELSEDSPRVPPVRDTEVIDGETYGGLKVACEDDVLAHFGDRATIVRPGVVAGPYDPTDRFTWWVRRAARGGRVALPGRPEQPVQVVDSGDLARLVTTLLGDDRPGIFNAVGPAEPVTLESLIRTCADAAGAGRRGRAGPARPGAAPLPARAARRRLGRDVPAQRRAGPRGGSPGHPAGRDGRRGARLGPRAG